MCKGKQKISDSQIIELFFIEYYKHYPGICSAAFANAPASSIGITNTDERVHQRHSSFFILHSSFFIFFILHSSFFILHFFHSSFFILHSSFFSFFILHFF